MYDYKEEVHKIYTDEGMKTFLAVRDNMNRKLSTSGAVRMSEATDCACGDGWTLMACVDRMVELGEILEITDESYAGQDRVFIKKGATA